MVQTFEAEYLSGAIRLPDDVHLPEHTKVYVVVPEASLRMEYHIRSPRLADPRQAADFVKEMIIEDADASV